MYDITIKEIEQWRKQGPLGKLHNFVVYIQCSVQREQNFWDLSYDLHLIRDNQTRWNSWFFMIERALFLKDTLSITTKPTLIPPTKMIYLKKAIRRRLRI